MEKSTEQIDKLNYYLYVKDELDKLNSSGSSLIKDKIKNINAKSISDSDIKSLCKYVEFLKISENSNILFYYDWFRHLRA